MKNCAKMKLSTFSLLILFLMGSTTWIFGEQINLASDKDWELSIDESGQWRPINVPFGGWNSDRQAPRISEDSDVKDHVTYRRRLAIPAEAAGNAVELICGAVNYGAEIFIDGKKVGEHVGPFTKFAIDLTNFVHAGGNFQLEVKAYTLAHYCTTNRDLIAQGKIKAALEKGNIVVPTGYVYFGHYTTLGYGITSSIALDIHPLVHLKDIFIRPSVSHQELSYDLWIENKTSAPATVTVQSTLESWNKDAWKYPLIGDVKAEVDAGATKKITIGPIPWNLGPASYWWPNIPFREDYQAKLHFLNLQLMAQDKVVEHLRQRFGFVEHTEGPYYYMVNGVRVNNFSDASAITQGSVYDGYNESPAFQPPTGPGTGCVETWKRYLRVGINTNRTHQQPPPESILDAADEVGFLLIPESAIRGSYLPQSRTELANYTPHLIEMIRSCRNHPSVARYSLCNEMGIHPEYLAVAAPEDPTRPYVFETNTESKSKCVTAGNYHAWCTAHYSAWPHPARQIFAMGEYAWSTDGMADFATLGKDMRLNDVCYFSGWSWLNYWPNFLQGMNHATYAWKQNDHEDRQDGVDGWGSPLVTYVQKALSPYLIMDREIERTNPYSPDWPSGSPTLKWGQEDTRSIEVFNNGLFGSDLTLRWSTHWDSPTGMEIEHGEIPVKIEPGFHQTQQLSFRVPALEKEPEKTLYLVMESVKEGKVVFREDRIRFRISDEPPRSEAVFLGEDALTSGNWKGKYGKDGYDLAGGEKDLPGYAQLKWETGRAATVVPETTDKRALQYFINDGQSGVHRKVAFYNRRGTISLSMDVGDSFHQVAFYLLDWNKHNTDVEKIQVPQSVGEYEVKEFQNGKYLLFKVRGSLSFVFQGAEFGRVAGVFFDPPSGVESKEKKDQD